MDEERFQKLQNKKWVGEQIEKFWESRGLDIQTLKERTGLTNLARYGTEGVIPHWDNLITIINACQAELSDFINFIDPPREAIAGIDIPRQHRPLFVMLSTILKNSEAAHNEKRIIGITVNLEDISARSIAELPAQVPIVEPQPGTQAQPIDKGEFSRSQVKRRLVKARDPTRRSRRKR